MEIAYMILVIAASFAITTAYYVSLYRKLRLKRGEVPKLAKMKLDKELVEKLRPALARKERELREVLGELRKIRKEVKEVLDEERGDLEGEGSGDKRSPERS